MKYSVLQFIDSKTLRSHLQEKTLEPAIECIVIAQSKKQPLCAKLEALQERYDAYSEAQFEEGIFHVGGIEYAEDETPFKERLGIFIEKMSEEIARATVSSAGESSYIFECVEDGYSSTSLFDSFEKAADYCRERELFCIAKNRINSPKSEATVYYLNEEQQIVHICPSDNILKNDISDAFAAIPHDYHVGDIIYAHDDYFVVMKADQLTEKPTWLDHADITDMQLYCFGYSPRIHNPFEGIFGHDHIPVLEAELANVNDLPQKQQPLLALSLVVREKMRLSDFLEAYSNGMLNDLMKYHREIQS